MATKFLEPGGDADFLVGTTNGFWDVLVATPAVATDHVHGGHIKSINYRPANNDSVRKDTILSDTGSRISLYIYLVALPSSTSIILNIIDVSTANTIFNVKLTSAGVIQLFETTSQIGSNGATLSTGQWYRISLAYTITSTTINRFELFVNGVSSISVTNATLTNTGSSIFRLGNISNNATLDFRSSDHYIDDSNSLTDPGNIWVTAKRPVSNGTINDFNTQIGAGGSGYGTGHSPQVNERPLSTTNGWSKIGAGSATYEVYNIETKSQGDIDISSATIIDRAGWISISSLVGESVQLYSESGYPTVINSTPTLYTHIYNDTTYPSPGGGFNIGVTTDNTLTTVSLYECGVLVAYIPALPITSGGAFLYNMI